MRTALVLLALVFMRGEAQGAPVSPADLQSQGIKAVARWLPYDQWTAEYRSYFQRHVHDPHLDLTPTAIVMHYTAGPTMARAWSSFQQGGVYNDGDVGQIRGHLSSHFIVDRDGTVYCCVPTNRRCRGAYGVNHVALSVEMVGRDEAAVLADPALVQASCRLVGYLCRRYAIPASRVWGHYQVAEGRSQVPDYLDYGDRLHPDRYPEDDWRTDPGRTYMQMLWRCLQAKGG